MDFQLEPQKKMPRWPLWTLTILGMAAILIYAVVTGDISVRGATVNQEDIAAWTDDQTKPVSP